VNSLAGILFPMIQESDVDVINLHWINNETITIKQIAKIGKPVVFTLHDMWAFCGAEHLSPDNRASRFRTGYLPDNRPMDQTGLDIDRWTWEQKRNYWQEPRHVICPSSWLARCARESRLMRGWPVHVVPNVLDVRQFQPLQKDVCRQALGLPPDIPLIAFGAAGVDYNKGYDLLISALNVLANEKCLSAVECVFFGWSQTSTLPEFGLPVHCIGRLHDDYSLALLYSAVDVVVVPSRQENLPQIATEAQACGTPVVAFNTAGLQDAVEHETTGYLAEPYVVEDLARGICRVLRDRSCYSRMSAAARERAVRLWSPEAVLPQYLDIYSRARNDRRSALQARRKSEKAASSIDV
jgi:glycosyltransferase involved in cell wall biosynthesis